MLEKEPEGSQVVEFKVNKFFDSFRQNLEFWWIFLYEMQYSAGLFNSIIVWLLGLPAFDYFIRVDNNGRINLKPGLVLVARGA